MGTRLRPTPQRSPASAYTVDARGNRTGVVETQALTPSGTDTHNIAYSYDALARLTQSLQKSGGVLGSGSLQHQFNYSYDVAGNRTQQIVNLTGTPTTTNYTYNAGNELTGDGTHTFVYDNAGNLLSDGVNTYSWDRANRLLSYNGLVYTYDGLGRRVQQVAGGSVTTSVVLDVQPGLAQVLQTTTLGQTTRFVQGPMGIHMQQNADATWNGMLLDGLGSVRSVLDSTPAVLESRLYQPFGEMSQTSGTQQTAFGFTGEETDSNGLVNLRARYYSPSLGQFFNLLSRSGVKFPRMIGLKIPHIK
jgi:hypothetical protein